MPNHTLKNIARQQLKIAFIESASAGYLACQCSKSVYSGDILQGSIVCYDLSVKKKLLRISDHFIAKHSPESKKMTEKLAKKGQKIFDADLIVACTGLLKPGGSETQTKPVGTFFYAIAYCEKIHHYRILCRGTPNQKLKCLYKNIMKSINTLIT